MTRRSDYLGDVLKPDGLRQASSIVCRMLRAAKLEFKAIAFRGLSGSLVAPLVAVQMNKKLIAVRKDEATHSRCLVESGINLDRPFEYVIVDDFISSGETANRIVEAIYLMNHRARPIAVCVYAAWSTVSPPDICVSLPEPLTLPVLDAGRYENSDAQLKLFPTKYPPPTVLYDVNTPVCDPREIPF